MERFTFLGSDIHVSAGCEPEVNRRLGRACGVMESLDHGVWHCRYLCGRMKVRVFRPLVLPVLLYGCETWTLTRDLSGDLIILVPGLFGESLAIAGWTLCPTSGF